MPRIRLIICLVALVPLSGAIYSCASNHNATALQSPPTARALKPIAMPAVGEDQPRDFPGIHNAVAYHEGFVSGSAPDGDAGFDTLAAMGIKTMISVDGTAPEVEKATVRGIRYVHLPIGYNGFDEQRRLQLARATRDAMKSGPVYIHCHHGKHRSAGAAAAIATSLGWLTADQGVARMKISGTAPEYKGLYACALGATVLATAAIDAISGDFPSVSRPSSYVQSMLEIDRTSDHLKTLEKAGWTTPKDHPDLVPTAEAGQLVDLFRMGRETPYARQRPADFIELLNHAGDTAQALEDLIGSGTSNSAQISAQFRLVSDSCMECHAKYRD